MLHRGRGGKEGRKEEKMEGGKVGEKEEREEIAQLPHLLPKAKVNEI